jgi:hypothetical protein
VELEDGDKAKQNMSSSAERTIVDFGIDEVLVIVGRKIRPLSPPLISSQAGSHTRIDRD